MNSRLIEAKARPLTGASYVYRYQQLDGGQALTIYGGKEPIRQKLHGELWVRTADQLPFRITIDSTHQMYESEVRDVTAVDYDIEPLGNFAACENQSSTVCGWTALCD